MKAIITVAEKTERTLAALLLIGALTGARRESCVLSAGRRSIGRPTVTIARAVYETPGGGWAEKGTKTHQIRTIGLDGLAIAVLKRHRLAAYIWRMTSG